MRHKPKGVFLVAKLIEIRRLFLWIVLYIGSPLWYRYICLDSNSNYVILFYILDHLSNYAKISFSNQNPNIGYPLFMLMKYKCDYNLLHTNYIIHLYVYNDDCLLCKKKNYLIVTKITF